MAQDVTPQITLHVDQHPHAKELQHGGYLIAELAPESVEIDRDLQPGDQVTISIANADGELIGQSVQEVGAVGFKPLKMEKMTVGQIRGHKSKATT